MSGAGRPSRLRSAGVFLIELVVIIHQGILLLSAFFWLVILFRLLGHDPDPLGTSPLQHPGWAAVMGAVILGAGCYGVGRICILWVKRTLLERKGMTRH